MKSLQELREDKQYLMILYNKKTGKPENIYGIQIDNHGYPLFLIKCDNQWKWRSAKHYLTRDERLHTYYSEAEKEFGCLV